MPRPKTVFSAEVSLRLGAYVYVLKDPLDGEPFYVGKGRGNRVFSHAADSLKSYDLKEIPNAKLQRIREIHDRGDDVGIELVRHGLDDPTAHEIEAVLIEEYGLTDLLHNLVKGHGVARGRMSPADVIALYDPPNAPPFPKALHAVVLRIPVLWYPSMTAHALYEATRGWWVIGSRRNYADFAFAVNRGVIREVYEIESWREHSGDEAHGNAASAARKRWGFDGSPAGREMDKYRNRSVRPLFRAGSSNPVRYINCEPS